MTAEPELDVDDVISRLLEGMPGALSYLAHPIAKSNLVRGVFRNWVMGERSKGRNMRVNGLLYSRLCDILFSLGPIIVC